MTSRNYDIVRRFNNANVIYDQYRLLSDNSPRINGKLKLRENKLVQMRLTIDSLVKKGNGSTHVGDAGCGIGSYDETRVPLKVNSLTSLATERYYYDLGAAEAAIGISILKWRESLQMILRRAHQIDQKVQHLINNPQRYKKRVRRSRGPSTDTQQLGNASLEVQFGWLPLVKDLNALIEQLGKVTIPPVKVRGTARETVFNTWADTRKHQFAGVRRVSVVSQVRVDNPNAWLLRQLGLTTVAPTAWDWVPWSWVVNMFTNMNVLLGQFTWESGLLVEQRSTTYSLRGIQWVSRNYPKSPGTSVECQYRVVRRERLLVNPPPVLFRFRWPHDPLWAAQIAISAVAQRVRKAAVSVPGALFPAL